MKFSISNPTYYQMGCYPLDDGITLMDETGKGISGIDSYENLTAVISDTVSGLTTHRWGIWQSIRGDYGFYREGEDVPSPLTLDVDCRYVNFRGEEHVWFNQPYRFALSGIRGVVEPHRGYSSDLTGPLCPARQIISTIVPSYFLSYSGIMMRDKSPETCREVLDFLATIIK